MVPQGTNGKLAAFCKSLYAKNIDNGVLLYSRYTNNNYIGS